MNIFNRTLTVCILFLSLNLGAQDVQVLGSDNDEHLQRMMRTSLGDYLIYGHLPTTDRKAFLMRADDNLNTYDQRILELPDAGFDIFDIKELPNGNFNLVGARWISSDRLSVVTAQLNPALGIVWAKEHANPSFNTELISLTNMNDGGFVAVGKRSGTIDTNSSVDILAVRFDATGDILWTTRCGETGGTDSDWGRNVFLSVNGDIIISGATYSRLNGGDYHDSYFVRLDANTGSIIKHGGFASSRNAGSSLIKELPNGSFIIASESRTDYSSTDYDLTVAKVKSNFTLVWERHYDVNNAPNLGGEFVIKNGIIYMATDFNGDIGLMSFDVNNGNLIHSYAIDAPETENRRTITHNGAEMVIAGSTDSYSISGAIDQDELLLAKFPIAVDPLPCLFKQVNTVEKNHSLGNDFTLSTFWAAGSHSLITTNLQITETNYELDTLSLCNAAPICTYAVDSDISYCSEDPTICVPLLAVNQLPNGIIGLDFCLDYDENILTPTGNVILGDVVLNGSVNADYQINTTTDPGKINVNIYYTTQAPAGSNFVDNGTIACIEFTVNDNFISGTTVPFDVCEIQESYELSTVPDCVQSGDFTLFIDSTLNCTVGINPEPAAGALVVYPTVFTNTLTVDLTEMTAKVENIALYDVHGKMLKTIGQPQGEIHLKTSELPAGIYFLNVDGLTKKVIKQ